MQQQLVNGLSLVNFVEWNKNNKNVIWLQANPYQKKRLEMYDKLHEEMKEKAAKRPKLIIE